MSSVSSGMVDRMNTAVDSTTTPMEVKAYILNKDDKDNIAFSTTLNLKPRVVLLLVKKAHTKTYKKLWKLSQFTANKATLDKKVRDWTIKRLGNTNV